jgi:hypothetical protein
LEIESIEFNHQSGAGAMMSLFYAEVKKKLCLGKLSKL